MFRLLIDQNFNYRIIRGLRLRMPALDMVFAADAGLGRFDDPDLLDWAAEESRITVSHDKKNAAHVRLCAGYSRQTHARRDRRADHRSDRNSDR